MGRASARPKARLRRGEIATDSVYMSLAVYPKPRQPFVVYAKKARLFSLIRHAFPSFTRARAAVAPPAGNKCSCTIRVWVSGGAGVIPAVGSLQRYCASRGLVPRSRVVVSTITSSARLTKGGSCCMRCHAEERGGKGRHIFLWTNPTAVHRDDPVWCLIEVGRPQTMHTIGKRCVSRASQLRQHRNR